MLLRRSAALSLLVVVLVLERLAHAQDTATTRAQLPSAVDDPRKGPRLVYRQGPRECLTEDAFRSEVAIAAQDGEDHLYDSSPDVVRVWFEKIRGGYRGTIEYTDATGAKDVPEVQTSYNCEILARWVASSVSDKIPREPAPSCPVCPAPLPAPSCPSCPRCGTSQPSAPRPVPLAKPPWRMDLSVGLSTYVMMSAFLSADVAPAFGIGADVRGEIFSIGLDLRFVVPSRAYARERIPGATSSFPVDFDLGQFSGSVVPCARYKYFVGCGVAQFGALSWQTDNDFNLGVAFGLGPRVGFEVPFAERFAVFGFGEVLFSPSRVALKFDLPDPKYPSEPPPNTQWVQSVASGFFGAGVSVNFK